MTEISRRLKHNRTLKGMTQEEVAALANVTPLTVIRIEQGSTIPRIDTIRKLAEALSMSAEDLAYGAISSSPISDDDDLDITLVRATAARMVDTARTMLASLHDLENSKLLPPKEIAKVRIEIKKQERHLRKMEQLEHKLNQRKD